MEQNKVIPLTQTSQAIDFSSREVIDTLKATVAKGASDAELAQFIQVCKGTGLNPFLREIWWVAATKTIMAARDGYLRKANEHPMFDGMETRVERDAKNVPVKAVCSVWRKDRTRPTICEAYYSEYRKEVPVWKQYPSAMISKVAEVLALKRSFSINGVVTEEEIGTPAPVALSPRCTEPPPYPEPENETQEPQPMASEIKSELKRIVWKMCASDKTLTEDSAFQFLMDNTKVKFSHIDKAETVNQLQKLSNAIEEGKEWLKNQGIPLFDEEPPLPEEPDHV